MNIWKVTCQVDNGARVFQETHHVVAPTDSQAVDACLRYWRQESNDTDAVLVALSRYDISENDVVIL